MHIAKVNNLDLAAFMVSGRPNTQSHLQRQEANQQRNRPHSVVQQIGPSQFRNSFKQNGGVRSNGLVKPGRDRHTHSQVEKISEFKQSLYALDKNYYKKVLGLDENNKAVPQEHQPLTMSNPDAILLSSRKPPPQMRKQSGDHQTRAKIKKAELWINNLER